MARTCLRVLFFIMIGMVLASCAAQTPQQGFTPEAIEDPEADPSRETPRQPTSQSPDSFVVDPETLEFGRYMEENVDNFLVILDASGSKFLPYEQHIKLKVAKDITRRFNQRTPERPLFGGLRRYGWEAGAFTTPTSLLYGMNRYDREDFGEAVEIVRWAGGKSPMALAIDKASDDLSLAPQDEYLALVIISDGKILTKDPNPVDAARRIKQRYGDRICIYTVAVGDDIPFDKAGTPEHQKKYREKYELLRSIAREGQCGYMVTSNDLIPDDNMDRFVHDVFHRGRTMEPKALEPCPDEDGDGVCDDVDKCPGTPVGAKVDKDGCWILDKVWFDLNKWNIKPEYRPVLDEIARVLKMNPDVALAVQGHTCTIWTEEYNMKLSHWRAMSVTAYLVSRGVNPEQLSVEGYGFHRPMASNRTDEGRRLNRRAEFRRIR
jgi:OmpA-OmpF porin, OOP family